MVRFRRSDDDGALPQVDVIPAKIASLRDPQTMAVDNQSDQPILGDRVGCP
jgi:hypothetical protein